MTTLVVPLDGSLLAEQSLPHVRMLAKMMPADIELLRVIPASPPDIHLAEELVAGSKNSSTQQQYHRQVLTERLTEEAEAYLLSHATMLRHAGFEVAINTYVGHAAEAIVGATENRDALIVMATHGHSGLRRWTLGSITDEVVHMSHIPVYIVRASDQLGSGMAQLPRTILVPLDGSDLAREAVPVAASIAKRSGATVVLLTAVIPLDSYDADVPVMPEDMPLLHDRLQQELSHTAKKLEAQDIHVEVCISNGFPPEVIVRKASRYQADLIVMSSHGRNGLRRWVLGSVADKVLHSTTQPLLIVRPSSS